MSGAVRFVAHFAWCAAAFAQASGTGVMSGRVMDSATGEPIRKVAVQSYLGTSYATSITNSRGEFRLEGLPAGSYRVLATKPGYINSAYGTERNTQPGTYVKLAAGEQNPNINFRLTPAGAVSGSIVDSDGEPVAQARVSLLREVWRRGRWQFQMASQAITDERGEYRMFFVPPGRYVLEAAAAFGSRLGKTARLAAYYPRASTLERAERLTVAPGKELSGLKIWTEIAPTASIRARVEGVPEGVQPNVSILTGSPENRVSYSHNGYMQGISVFQDVPPGSYEIRATAGQLLAVEKLTLAPGADRELTLRLKPFLEMNGEVVVEGPGAEKFRNFKVTLTRPTFRGGPAPTAAADPATLKFKFTGLEPGAWDIGVNVPPNGYLKSMALGDLDVLNEEMELNESPGAPLKIVVGTDGAQLTIEMENALPAIALIAPTGKLRDIESHRRFLYTDADGKIPVRGMPPGEYRVWAFEDVDASQLSPEFLDRHEKFATTVRLAAGQSAVVKVKRIESAGGVR